MFFILKAHEGGFRKRRKKVKIDYMNGNKARKHKSLQKTSLKMPFSVEKAVEFCRTALAVVLEGMH